MNFLRNLTHKTPRISTQSLKIVFALLCIVIFMAFVSSISYLETVDSNGLTGRFNDIVLDSKGISHIVYTSSGGDLAYCNNTGGSWSCLSIKDDETYNYNSIDIDQNDILHIATTGSSNGLVYCNNTGGSWSCQSIENQGVSSQYASIDVDNNSIVHIAYRNFSNSGIRYCNNTGGSWSCGTVESGGSLGHYIDILAVNTNDVYISHADLIASSNRYCRNNLGSWSCNVLSSNGLAYAKMAIDKDGYVNFAIVKSNNYIYICRDKYGSMECHGVGDETGYNGQYMSLTRDPTGYLFLTNTKYTNGDLYGCYSISDEGDRTWNCSKLASNANDNSVVIDNLGGYHISFYMTISSDLNYLVNTIFIENAIDYNKNIFELSPQTFNLNITYNSSEISSISSSLEYNGTEYPSTVTIDGDNAILSNTINIPKIDNSLNISFYWKLNLEGYQNSFNSTNRIQQVFKINLDDCSIYGYKIINYSLKDEDNLGLVPASSNETTAITLSIGSIDLENSESISFNTSNKNVIEICSNAQLNNSNLRIDSEIQYTSTDRVTEFHNIQNQTTYGALPLIINLYDLLITRSQEFLITYKDSNFIPVNNALIYLKRKYLNTGEFLDVEVPKTDTDGRTIGHFVLNDETYTLEVRKEGQLLAVFDNVRAFCDDILTGNCRINLNADSSTTSIDDLQSYKDVKYNTNYNENTRTYTFSFLTVYGDNKEFNLTIKEFNSAFDNVICSKVITTSSGSLSCQIADSYGNITVVATTFVDDWQISQEIFKLKTSLTDIIGKSRYLLALVLILTIPLIAFTNAVMMLVLFMVGLVIAGGLFLLDSGGVIGSTSAILWFIVAGGVILWKITSGGKE